MHMQHIKHFAKTKYFLILRLIQYALLVAAVFFLGVFISKNWNQFYSILTQVKIQHLILIVAILTISNIMIAYCWALVIKSEYNKISYPTLLCIWHTSLLSSYIPGFVWMFLNRHTHLRKHGVSTAMSTFSMSFEQVIVLFSAVPFAILFVKELYNVSLVVLFVSISACVLVILLKPNILFATATAITGRQIKTTISVKPLTFLVTFFILSLQWILKGGVILLLISIVSSTDATIELLQATAMHTTSFIAGYLSFFAPKGIGVKEGTLALLLSTVTGMPNAIVCALLLRFCSLITNVLSGGFSFLVSAHFKIRET